VIAAQRRWHRAAFAGLAVAVPTLLVGAVLRRPAGPGTAQVPSWLDGPSRAALTAFDGAPVTALALRPGAPGRLRLSLPEAWNRPDVLLYWSADPEAGNLPADARLLGALDGRRFVEFPAPAGPGRLWLHSPATSEVLAVLDPAEGVR